MYPGKIVLASLLIVVVVVGAYLLIRSTNTQSNRPLTTVDGYLRATYARDFAQAYNYLSSADRHERPLQNFVNSQGPYSGFTLQVARQLAGFMEVWLIARHDRNGRSVTKIGYRAPAPAELNNLLFNWEQERLNNLSNDQQKQLLAKLDSRSKSGKLLKIEGQETIELVEESAGWKVFLDWSGGTRVVLQSKTPDNERLKVRFAVTELMVKHDELFLVNVRVNNPSAHAVTFSVGHLLDPPAAADDLQLVECGLLIPTVLEAKQEKEFAMAYQLNTTPGQIHREVRLTYEFNFK